MNGVYIRWAFGQPPSDRSGVDVRGVDPADAVISAERVAGVVPVVEPRGLEEKEVEAGYRGPLLGFRFALAALEDAAELAGAGSALELGGRFGRDLLERVAIDRGETAACVLPFERSYVESHGPAFELERRDGADACGKRRSRSANDSADAI